MGPFWLDLSRSLSRVGRPVGTGIDRVERAYLDHLLQLDDPDTRFLVRTTRGGLLFKADGAAALRPVLDDAALLPSADVVSRLFGKGTRPRHRAEALLRRHAIDRAPVWGIDRMVARHACRDLAFLNVGHTHLTRRVLRPLRDAGARVGVMIHDLIPLTHPDTVPAGLPARFATRIETVRAHADTVLCNSAQTDRDLTHLWKSRDRRPDTVITPLGVDRVPARYVEKDPASFVILGTVEPRKNHALLLDVWTRLQDETLPHRPVLHMIGARGWHDPAFFAQLEAHPLYGDRIIEHGPLPDAAARDMVAAARALLFPSRAEGYGYPPLEAQMLGTLPIVSDIPVLHEVLGRHAVYLPPNDAYLWAETIKKCLFGTLSVPEARADPPPSWDAHFRAVHRSIWGDKAKDSA